MRNIRKDDFIITDDLENLMKTLESQTENDKKIRALLLCKDKDGTIIPSKVTIGDESGISLGDIEGMRCPVDTIEVGYFRSKRLTSKGHFILRRV